MKFDILDIIFLPILLFLGIITSWSDIRSGKISNKWIIFGLLWGLGGYFSIFVCSQFKQNDFLKSVLDNILFNQAPLNLIKYVFLNSFCALVLGYVFWYFNFWSAGDAKLFFVFSLILPLKYYFKEYILFFPSLVLLINIFFCALIFLFVSFSPQMIRSVRIFFIFILRLLKPFVVFPSFNKIREFFGGGAIRELFLLIKSKSSFLENFFNSILMLVSAFLVLRLASDNIANHLLITLLNLSTILCLMVFSGSLLKIVKKVNKAMIVLLIVYFGGIISFFPSYIKPTLFYFSNMIIIFMGFYFGLTILPKVFIRRSIVQKMPFAIWLTFGAILTFFLRGSILSIFR